jgi:hypothetical protein
MSRGEGLFFKSPRGESIPVGTMIEGQVRCGGGKTAKKTGTLSYRSAGGGMFCIMPFSESGAIPISEAPGHVHPGTVVTYRG